MLKATCQYFVAVSLFRVGHIFALFATSTIESWNKDSQGKYVFEVKAKLTDLIETGFR